MNHRGNMTMIRRIFLFVLLGLTSSLAFNARCSMLMAQETFTDRLRQPMRGQGMVRLYHDMEIDGIVNGEAIQSTKNIDALKMSPLSQWPDTTELPGSSFNLRKARVTGYRVQVYSGGNSRDAKARAYQMESLVKVYAPGQPVYTRFVSPRWICHVGDFRTRDEALEFLDELRKTGRFSEAITVKCKINVMTYDE